MCVFKGFRTFHSTPWFRGHESKALWIFGNIKHDFLQTSSGIFMVNLTYPIYISKMYMLLLRKYLRLKYFLRLDLRATCVLPDPKLLPPEVVRKKATVWLQGLTKCILPEKQVSNSMFHLEIIFICISFTRNADFTTGWTSNVTIIHQEILKTRRLVKR